MTPRVLLDTNVVLDVLLARDPWLNDSRAVWEAVDQGRLEAYLLASVLTDIYYVARRLSTRKRARQALQVCLDAFAIAAIGRDVLERALALSGSDYEDDVLIACAETLGLDGIVTRDTARFRAASLGVWTPRECLDRLPGH
ncbi:MAG: PIN domain-containing protein [Candidatus Eremiobacterota bacterium]